MQQARLFRMPPILHVGQGAASRAGEEALRLGARRALLITDEFLASSGVIDPVLASLSDVSVTTAVYAEVNTEPTLAHVDACMALCADEPFDLVIGVGGGSPIDVAKAASAMAANPGHLRDYMGINKLEVCGPPIMAIPTTAGTGSEATCTTIISDTGRNIKMLIISDKIMPAIALVDPLLTTGMPKRITAATGLDALTHGIEAYVSRKAQPMSDIFALNAISLISTNLPIAWAEPGNIEAREKTLLGALQAGIAFSNASVALVHGMSRPIGALFHVPHGVSNAALLSVVTRFSLPGAYERYAHVARAMGIDDQGSAIKTAEAGAEYVKKLIEQLEIPSLSALGVSKEKLDAVVDKMADDAMSSGSPANNPRIATKDEIISLYYEAL